ncbi:FAD-binding domain-containing protein [Xylariaceae sp. FL0594]|nr:FAD-binding domain-containing protein [Xylariaceae sp. FL0594]
MALGWLSTVPSTILLILGICGSRASADLDARDGQSSCRCFPSDPCWPQLGAWNSFNSSLGGKLIAYVPIAAPCHYSSTPGYAPAKCKALQDGYFFPETHIMDPGSTMAPFFTNNSCNPFSSPSAACTLGNYPRFVVNAASAADYQKTIAFCAANNIRLVIRNTGHDYNGKSIGAGSVALWTQHLKLKQKVSFSSAYYTGPAFRFGAGVLVREALEYADSFNLLIVGANLPTVGLAGGYAQGGGHGPLASTYGLAADQVLEWQVVLASQEIVTATRDSPDYADLFWALCGGGGGTFGAVVSVTVKAYPTTKLASASMTFGVQPNAPNSTLDAFFGAVDVFLQQIPSINDAGAVAVFYLTAQSFQLASFFAPNSTIAKIDQLLKPVTRRLQSVGLNYTYMAELNPTFLQGYDRQPLVNVSQLNIGGQMLPRSVLSGNTGPLTSALRSIANSGALVSGVTFNVSQRAPDYIGVNPAWRDAVVDIVVANFFNYADWGANQMNMDTITHVLLPQLQALAPNGGVYLNEADSQQPNWQQAFYGSHYSQLLQIKQKYDANGLLYALGAVGSESWVQKPDGKLCRSHLFTRTSSLQ